MFLALGFMRDVPTLREQPDSAAPHGMGEQGWAAWLTWQGDFGVKDPSPGRLVRLLPV